MKKDVLFIDEKTYQQMKKVMCKGDDYFTSEELKNLQNIPKVRRNLGETFIQNHVF